MLAAGAGVLLPWPEARAAELPFQAVLGDLRWGQITLPFTGTPVLHHKFHVDFARLEEVFRGFGLETPVRATVLAHGTPFQRSGSACATLRFNGGAVLSVSAGLKHPMVLRGTRQTAHWQGGAWELDTGDKMAPAGRRPIHEDELCEPARTAVAMIRHAALYGNAA